MAKTEDLLRARFKEAVAERDAIEAELTPIRAARDAIMAKAAKIEAGAAPLNERLLARNPELIELHNEIATISRALKGETA